MDFDSCRKALKDYPFVEFRYDLLDLDRRERKQLIQEAVSSIATCRTGKYDDNVRKEMLTNAIRDGATYVDLEIEAGTAYRDELSAMARQQGTKIIISYHNFDQTPPQNELYEMIERAASMDPDIIKLACQVNTAEDAALLMGTYRREHQMVSLGMGDRGLITRIAAPFLGAAFTFAAPDEGTETAPGQLSYGRLKEILTQIENANIESHE